MTALAAAPSPVDPHGPDPDTHRRAWVATWCLGASALGPVLARPHHNAGVVTMVAPDGRYVGVVDYTAPATVGELAVLLAYTHGGACAAWDAGDGEALALAEAASAPFTRYRDV